MAEDFSELLKDMNLQFEINFKLSIPENKTT